MSTKKIQFAGSNRMVDITKYNEFSVIQDNRSKKVEVVEYESSIGTRDMIFLNGVQAVLKNGRYIMAQSKASFCARLIDHEPEVVEE